MSTPDVPSTERRSKAQDYRRERAKMALPWNGALASKCPTFVDNRYGH
jgi:hypothetical protein